MPKVVDHHRYRLELLGRCLTLFAEQGFQTVTMRQIAGHLGVSTGTLYHYFPNKESIFAQLVEEYCEKSVAEFFVEAPMNVSVEAKLQCVMTYFLQHFANYQQQLMIWIDFYQHSQQQGDREVIVLREFWQRTHAKLSAYLQLEPACIDLLLTCMDGLLLQFLYGRTDADIKAQADLAIALLSASMKLPTRSSPQGAAAD